MKQINDLYDLIGEKVMLGKHFPEKQGYYILYPAIITGYNLNTYYFYDKGEGIYLEIDAIPLEGYNYKELLKLMGEKTLTEDVLYDCFNDIQLENIHKYNE